MTAPQFWISHRRGRLVARFIEGGKVHTLAVPRDVISESEARHWFEAHCTYVASAQAGER